VGDVVAVDFGDRVVEGVCSPGLALLAEEVEGPVRKLSVVQRDGQYMVCL